MQRSGLPTPSPPISLRWSSSRKRLMPLSRNAGVSRSSISMRDRAEREREREREREKVCYADLFYESHDSPIYGEHINGFPKVRGGWCKRLKYSRETDIRGYLLSTSKVPEGGGGNRIYGFPMLKGNWCTSDLKQRALRQSGASIARENSNLRFSGTCKNGTSGMVHRNPQDQTATLFR